MSGSHSSARHLPPTGLLTHGHHAGRGKTGAWMQALPPGLVGSGESGQMGEQTTAVREVSSVTRERPNSTGTHKTHLSHRGPGGAWSTAHLSLKKGGGSSRYKGTVVQRQGTEG